MLWIRKAIPLITKNMKKYEVEKERKEKKEKQNYEQPKCCDQFPKNGLRQTYPSLCLNNDFTQLKKRNCWYAITNI